MSGCPLLPHFEHKKIFSGQKSQLFHFKADLPENFRICSSDSKDCHWRSLQSQLGHFVTNFEHKEIFSDKKVNFFILRPICLKTSEDVHLTVRIVTARFQKSARQFYFQFRTQENILSTINQFSFYGGFV